MSVIHPENHFVEIAGNTVYRLLVSRLVISQIVTPNYVQGSKNFTELPAQMFEP